MRWWKPFSFMRYGIFTFLSQLFCYVEILLHEKSMVNFKNYDAADWMSNNCNTHIALVSQEVKVTRWQDNENLVS